MITITCTKRQKKTIIESLLNPRGCLWPAKRQRCAFDLNSDCEKCFKQNIKWIIVSAREANQ